MADYIERQAVIDAVEGLDWYCVFYGRIIHGAKDTKTALYKAEDVYEVLAKLPAADAVEVRHGRWTVYVISMIDGEGCKCSECGFEGVPYWDYCPNCGARMDGEQNG